MKLLRLVGAALLYVGAEIGAFELMLLVGLALVGYGAFMIFPPAAFLAPGFVLLAFAWRGMNAG